MNIVEDNHIGSKVWTDLVKVSPVATWFQTREAYLFFDGLPFLDAFSIGLESEGNLRAVTVGYVIKDGERLKQFLSRRAIIIGGPLLSEDITDEELKKMLFAVKERLGHKAIYIETRNFNDYSKWRDVFQECGFGYEQHLNYVVDCVSADKLWSNLKENRKRQIKKALKEGVEIKEATSEEEVRQFYSILSALYSKRVKKPLFDLEFFMTFYRKNLGVFLLVKYDEHIIGGIMCPILDNRVIYEWFICGEDSSYKAQYPSVMATWAAIDYANKNSISKFDFMGAGKPNEKYGVRDFKSKFGGEMQEYGRFVAVCHPLLYFVGKLGIKVMALFK